MKQEREEICWQTNGGFQKKGRNVNKKNNVGQMKEQKDREI
jgi:hypothetical protein